MKSNSEIAITATVAWLELVVIDLNLCPFAKSVHAKNQIRYSTSEARDTAGLLAALKCELSRLVEIAPTITDSTLLIYTEALRDFVGYGHFLDLSMLLLEEMKLEGIIQIASFHPEYQFEGTSRSDITNWTNRSPYPMLHLLREDSVTRAVQSYVGSEAIYERNVATMKATGEETMVALMSRIKRGCPIDG